MPWLKMFHIAFVILWAGSLLYLIAAIGEREEPARARLVRALFTTAATPAALLAIASGTLIFLLRGPLAPWLMAKLGMVALLVLAHASCGALLLRAEDHPRDGRVRPASIAVGGLSVLCLGTIAWLVLAKPF